MKLTYSRRYRRSTSRSRENAMFKKDNQQEHAFFAAPSRESFFKPNIAIQRKCDKCASEDKKVSRMSDSKEEEKKVQKMEEKKEEEKSVQKMEDKKEEKEVQKMDEKKEEKEMPKMEEKKEEKEVKKTEDKKEEEKTVQKMSDTKEEEKKVSKMEDKKGEEKEEEKKVAKKEANPSATRTAGASDYIYSLNGKGQALPVETQYFFRKKIGYDFSQVRIHTSTEAEESARQINAKAYAVDNHVVFNKGQYNPGSAEGKKLLAHELAHVVQNYKPELLKTQHQPVSNNKQVSQPIVETGKAAKSNNKKAFACEGVEVEAQTVANYSNFFTFTKNLQHSTECDNCTGPDCITANGTIVSVFRARPTVTLPPVPEGLNACERRAVRTFINTTLRQHEQQHVTAFNTYNGTVRTPYTYTGCKDGLNAYVQSIHDNLNTQREAAANALSNALDPFNPTIPFECE